MDSDQALHAEITKALTSGLQFNQREIEIAVSHGYVTLSGRVHSQAERIAVTREIKRIEGVRGISDELVLTFSHGVVPADAEVAAAVRRALETALPAAAREIRIRVEGGEVALEGEFSHVPDPQLLEQTLRRLPGVRRVEFHVLQTSGAQLGPRRSRLATGLPWSWREDLRDRAAHAHPHGDGGPTGNPHR